MWCSAYDTTKSVQKALGTHGQWHAHHVTACFVYSSPHILLTVPIVCTKYQPTVQHTHATHSQFIRILAIYGRSLSLFLTVCLVLVLFRFLACLNWGCMWSMCAQQFAECRSFGAFSFKRKTEAKRWWPKLTRRCVHCTSYFTLSSHKLSPSHERTHTHSLVHTTLSHTMTHDFLLFHVNLYFITEITLCDTRDCFLPTQEPTWRNSILLFAIVIKLLVNHTTVWSFENGHVENLSLEFKYMRTHWLEKATTITRTEF